MFGMGRILTPPPAIQLLSPIAAAQNLNHWIAREISCHLHYHGTLLCLII